MNIVCALNPRYSLLGADGVQIDPRTMQNLLLMDNHNVRISMWNLQEELTPKRVAIYLGSTNLNLGKIKGQESRIKSDSEYMVQAVKSITCADLLLEASGKYRYQ